MVLVGFRFACSKESGKRLRCEMLHDSDFFLWTTAWASTGYFDHSLDTDIEQSTFSTFPNGKYARSPQRWTA